MHGELPKLEKQLAETTGLFKGKERKALQVCGLQGLVDSFEMKLQWVN
jgi:hypothetical protein